MALVVLSLYLATLAPGITWANWGADGGDYLSALYTDGIPHPSGYPTYLAAAKIFSLLPIGTLAFRMNVFSAACMAAASVILFWTLTRLLSSGWLGTISAFIGTACFALSPLVWSQAVITEVYGLHSLFVAGFVSLLLVGMLKSLQSFFLAAILLGVGLGNHLTLSLLAPLFLLMPLHNETSNPFLGRVPRGLSLSQGVSQSPGVRRQFSLASKVWLQIERLALVPKILGILLGAGLAYSSLLLLAKSDSPVRWLNPTNVVRLWDLISARMYHLYWGLPADQNIFTKTQATVMTLYAQFGPMGFALIIIGSFALLRNKSHVALPVAWLLIASLLFTVGYQTEDAAVYLIPAVLAGAICIAFGVQYLVNRFSAWRVPAILPISVIGLLLLVQIASAYQSADASRDKRALEFMHEVARSAPHRAMIFTSEDKETFSLWYSQYVEGVRPDIAIIVTPFLNYDWYREVVSSAYPDLVLPPPNTKADRGVIEQMNDRPSCSTSSLAKTVLDCR